MAVGHHDWDSNRDEEQAMSRDNDKNDELREDRLHQREHRQERRDEAFESDEVAALEEQAERPDRDQR